MRALILVLLLIATPLSAKPWQIVAEDTWVRVDVGWLGNTIRLIFEDVSGEISFDAERPARTEAMINVATGTVETGLGIVNTFVKSRDYLNAETYPEIGFALDRLTVTSPQTADIEGRITFRGMTQPVLFAAEVFRFGESPDADGAFDAGFVITGEIDRRRFGHTAGLPQVSAVLPVRIRLLIRTIE